MICNLCHQEINKLVYRRQINNSLHLVGLCENHGWRYLPYESGLDIPIIERKLKSTRKNGARIDAPRFGVSVAQKSLF